MAQGGDPTGTGMGGSDKPDLQAEFSREPHVRGTASMARSQNPNSANSQFFICFDDARFLDGQYTVWGEVDRGHGACRRSAQGRAAARSPARSSKRQPEGLTAWRGRSRSSPAPRRGSAPNSPGSARKRGEALALVARRRDRLEALAAELGGDVHIFAADLAKEGAAASLIAELEAEGLERRHPDQQCRLRPRRQVRRPAARPAERDDRPQRPHADRALPSRPAGDARARARRDPQRRLDRRLPAGAEHGGLLCDQGLCPLLHRGAAPRAEGQRHQRLRALPRPDRTASSARSPIRTARRWSG